MEFYDQIISDAILPLNVICAFFADSKSQLLNFVSVLPPFRKSAFPTFSTELCECGICAERWI